MLAKDFVLSNKYKRLPSWLQKRLKQWPNTEIEKIFPSIGLSNNVQRLNKKYNIGFTSDGVQGLWDLATMSMRGVSSCMRWGSNQSTHLLGSIVDPFCGMVYLSNNKKNKYGKLFHKRALVRFISYCKPASYEFRRQLTPALFIERVYSNNGNGLGNRDQNANKTMEIFKKYLLKKTNNKFKIYTCFYKSRDNLSRIPFSDFYSLDSEYTSLSDYGLVVYTPGQCLRNKINNINNKINIPYYSDVGVYFNK